MVLLALSDPKRRQVHSKTPNRPVARQRDCRWMQYSPLRLSSKTLMRMDEGGVAECYDYNSNSDLVLEDAEDLKPAGKPSFARNNSFQ